MRRSITVVLLGVLAGCEPGSELIFGESNPGDVVGFWVGEEEITTAEDPGSGATLGQQGFSFPIALQLRSDGRFRLTTTNFPAEYGNEASRRCDGVYDRTGRSIEFFADRACRALPLARYTLGRTLPRGLTLNASTASLTAFSPATIRVRIRLSRE